MVEVLVQLMNELCAVLRAPGSCTARVNSEALAKDVDGSVLVEVNKKGLVVVRGADVRGLFDGARGAQSGDPAVNAAACRSMEATRSRRKVGGSGSARDKDLAVGGDLDSVSGLVIVAANQRCPPQV